MEGILYDISLFESPVAILTGLALLAIAVGVVLLGHMADEEAKGERVFWAESPFSGAEEAPAREAVKFPKAA